MKSVLLGVTALGALLLCGACADRKTEEDSAPDASESIESEQSSLMDDLVLPFSAGGNEPGWHLGITSDSLVLQWNYGQDRLAIPAADYSRDKTAGTYLANTERGPIAISVINELCSDDMSGMPHPNRVEVDVDGHTLTGCGGQPRSLFTGAQWTVASLNGTPVPDGTPMTLQFETDGRLSGHSGCNSYSASYMLSGEGISIGNMVSTRKACRPERMTLESQFGEVLQAVSTFEVQSDGALVLQSSAGGSIRARR